MDAAETTGAETGAGMLTVMGAGVTVMAAGVTVTGAVVTVMGAGVTVTGALLTVVVVLAGPDAATGAAAGVTQVCGVVVEGVKPVGHATAPPAVPTAPPPAQMLVAGHAIGTFTAVEAI